ncbi:uncharacterized protein DEA37_0014864 [Paragonimus westermani]|uniref:Reverse transcriptase domain-containing protein n=1 Tax=Paragonimus westermani TaxID=34504 RepID=A0A5J4NXM6_9TREM|nr:uncharacterized protein DEA37_0014864 [Paragonimus westermani]
MLKEENIIKLEDTELKQIKELIFPEQTEGTTTKHKVEHVGGKQSVVMAEVTVPPQRTYINRLRKSRTKYGEEPIPSDSSKYVLNCSSIQLDSLQLEALALGLDYKIRAHKVDRICVEAQFENLIDQLSDLRPTSADNLGRLKTKFTDIAYGFIRTPINSRCAITKQHLQSLRELKSKNVVILKPDKGSGAVILDKDVYVQKMLSILDDQTKFRRIERVDNIGEIEDRIGRHLQLLLQLRIIDEVTYKSLKPRGSSTPQLYGLPKTHKSGMPLRPILAMTNSPYHKLARWLVTILTPVKQKFQKYSIKDSFELISDLDRINLANELMCSIDVQSLFTNVPLHETIDYICELVEMSHTSLPLPTDILKETLLLCTENVSFRFLEQSYRQIDGVAMGSPLGPIIADFFMLKIEQQLATEIENLSYYKRYVDDTLIFSRSKQMIDNLVQRLNSCHPNLKVTCEFEVSNCLPFLDILISRREDGSVRRTVYRKPTWSGQYLNFSSFTPIQHKRALVNTLFTRARRICTPDSLAEELDLITSVLQSNGYPRSFIDRHSRPKLPSEKVVTVEKKRVYIELPFKGDYVMQQTSQRLRNSIKRTFNAAELRVIARTQKLPVPSIKGDQPIGATSHCVYQFVCNCGESYIGRTERCLISRMKEHLPKWVQKSALPENGNVSETHKQPVSSVARHVLTTGHATDPSCAFKILLRHSNPRFLRFAEAVAINRLKPALCVQKQLFVNLTLPWT